MSTKPGELQVALSRIIEMPFIANAMHVGVCGPQFVKCAFAPQFDHRAHAFPLRGLVGRRGRQTNPRHAIGSDTGVKHPPAAILRDDARRLSPFLIKRRLRNKNRIPRVANPGVSL